MQLATLTNRRPSERLDLLRIRDTKEVLLINFSLQHPSYFAVATVLGLSVSANDISSTTHLLNTFLIIVQLKSKLRRIHTFSFSRTKFITPTD